MKKNIAQLLVWMAFLIPVILVFRVDPGLVRDSDQGAMLAGGLRLASGEASVRRPGFYAYDRSWAAYALAAGAFRVERLLTGSAAAVPTANRLTRVLFWGAWLLFLAGPGRARGARLAAWCVLTAPAVLLASVYWNTTALSSACVALGACALARRGGRGRAAWAAAAFGLAAGIRSDTLLLAPLLCWLFLPRRTLAALPRALLRSPAMLPVAAMLAAVVVGRLLAGGGSGFLDLFFLPLAAGGYLVFGVAGIVLAAGAMLAARRRGAGRTRFSWFEAAGLLALLLPWIFYLPQLHTPRYLLRAGEAVLLAACSRRGRAWLRRAFDLPCFPRVALAVLAALPLLLGLRLPFPARPRLTFSDPGVYPTGDGFHPMGATAAFLAGLRDTERSPLDHNQVLWQALRRTDWPEEGPWRMSPTPQWGLVELRAAEVGARIEWDTDDHEPGLHAETRSMLRRDPKQPAYEAARLLDRPGVPVSPRILGLGIVRLDPGDTAWSRDLRLLRRLFEGAEYRERRPRPGDEGRTVVFFSDEPFTVTEERGDRSVERLPAERDDATGLYSIRRTGAEWAGARHRVQPDPAEVRSAVRVFPDWMR